MRAKAQELQEIYRQRFVSTAAYRKAVWRILTAKFFIRWIPTDSTVLDLGCGWGEFINHIAARKKYALDLNPDARKHLAPGITLLEQDCMQPWSLPENSLDIVFTSNFFEHLPDKDCLQQTLKQAYRSLRPGGLLIAMGPNIKYLAGHYWDFFDHHTVLTEASLAEAMMLQGFELDYVTAKFLPYTMVKAPQYPLWMVRTYLSFPFLWWFWGKQFLVVARKP